MGAHTWVVVLSVALGVAVVGDVLLNHQRSIWKRAFVFRVEHEQLRNQHIPSGPSDHDTAMREVRRG